MPTLAILMVCDSDIKQPGTANRNSVRYTCKCDERRILGEVDQLARSKSADGCDGE